MLHTYLEPTKSRDGSGRSARAQAGDTGVAAAEVLPDLSHRPAFQMFLFDGHTFVVGQLRQGGRHLQKSLVALSLVLGRRLISGQPFFEPQRGIMNRRLDRTVRGPPSRAWPVKRRTVSISVLVRISRSQAAISGPLCP